MWLVVVCRGVVYVGSHEMKALCRSPVPEVRLPRELLHGRASPAASRLFTQHRAPPLLVAPRSHLHPPPLTPSHPHTLTLAHALTLTHSHSYTHNLTHTNTHSLSLTHTHTRTHARIHACTYTHTHTHTHAHTHTFTPSHLHRSPSQDAAVVVCRRAVVPALQAHVCCSGLSLWGGAQTGAC